ncbi:MAG TPA: hypothetical protein VNT58_09470 [Gaiellaceae bacterium]|nr:hypothetical protein [Gaiellaceae bacterium]
MVRVEKGIALRFIAQINRARVAKGRQPLRTESRMMESTLWKAAQSANLRGRLSLSARCNDAPWGLTYTSDTGDTKGTDNYHWGISSDLMEPQWRSIGIGVVIGSESPVTYTGSGYTLYYAVELSEVEGDGEIILTDPQTKTGRSPGGTVKAPAPAAPTAAKRAVLTVRVTNDGVVPITKPSLAKVVLRSATVKSGRVTVAIKLGRKILGRKVVTLRNGRATVPVTQITRARFRADDYIVTAKLPGKPLISKLFMAR